MPSLNCSSWLNICAVSCLNLLFRTMRAYWLLSFFFNRTPGVSPYKLSICRNKFLAGPLLFLKWVWMLCLLKWLKHNMLFFWSCWAITRVRIDLLYGKNSVLEVFLDCFCFLILNLLRISRSVVILLSCNLERGRLINVNVFRVLNECLFTNLNWITSRSSFSSDS